MSSDFTVPLKGGGATLHVNLATQQLIHIWRDGTCRYYDVSTSKHGAGEMQNSFCTPRGLHLIRAKIGDGAGPLAVFKGRRQTGESYIEAHDVGDSPRDWILGRILWLSGLESYFNRGGAVDTMRRFIYIHGTPPNTHVKVPGSMGCIRMRCDALLELFDHVSTGERLMIHEAMNSPSVIVQRWPEVYESCQWIRRSVFQHEQGIAALDDEDGQDGAWLHLLAFGGDGFARDSFSAVGTARLEYHQNDTGVCWKLGRMAVLKSRRHQGVGRAMVEKAKQIALYSRYSSRLENAQSVALSLHAQANAIAFYQRCGFVAEGEMFDDAGIPHQMMRYVLA